MTSFTRLASHISFIVASCLLASVVDSSSAHAAEAGVDGDHIYAGVSYSSIESYDRCEWVRPITIHQQGVSPSVIRRQWQGISWSLNVCSRDGTEQFAWLTEITTEEVAESTRSVV
ncbi:MAG: hypothetical protein ACKPCO_03070, partial [Actinomycetota bacterium]